MLGLTFQIRYVDHAAMALAMRLCAICFTRLETPTQGGTVHRGRDLGLFELRTGTGAQLLRDRSHQASCSKDVVGPENVSTAISAP